MHRPREQDVITRPFYPRNPWSNTRRPLSVAVYAPAAILQDSETPTEYSPYGTFVPRPFFGGYDGLQGRLMHVPQADLYDASPNPWPNNGQFDRPSGLFSITGAGGGLWRKPPSTSAHRGFAQPTGPGPSMMFHAPPVFSLQTTPIPAVGV